MIRGNKIKQFLIILAGLVLVLHAVVPHHHHIDCSEDDNKSEIAEFVDFINAENCSDNDLSHCHALNNLDIKVTDSNTSVIPQSSETLINGILLAVLTDAASTPKNVENAPVSDIVLQKQFFISQLSFRGPPALAHNTIENLL